MKYPSIAKTIIDLKKLDLQLRERLVLQGKLNDGYNHEMEQLHKKNAVKLEEIINRIGYPTADHVGKEANEAAWLIIQHAIAEPIFMRKCVALLRLAVINDNENPIHLAYLEDRIAVFEEKPQRYGTQFDWDENNVLSPQPFDSEIEVNKRRKAIGLNSLEAQIEIIRCRSKQENQLPPNDFNQRKKELKRWKRKVGWI